MKNIKWIVLGALIVNCSPHKVTHNPAPPVVVPANFSQVARAQSDNTDSSLPEKWWQDFGDSQLNELVETMLKQNLDLHAAWARFYQAKVLLKPAKFWMLPDVTADVSATRQKSRFDLGPPVGEVTPTITVLGASLGATYEIDIWKRLYNNLPARELSLEAAHDGISAIAISLVASVTETWFDIIFQTAQKELLAQQLRTSQTFLDLVELRFQEGLASALDVYQQRQQLVATRSQVAMVDAALGVAQNQLAVLLGVAPGSLHLEPAAQLPEVPPLPALGIPGQVLLRRPDVRAAKRAVEIADYDVAIAVSNMLPRLRLGGSVGMQSDKVSTLVSTPLWSFLGGITAPIFQRGVLKAVVRSNKAIVQEKLASYGQSVLKAIAEVENASLLEQQQTVFLVDLREQVRLLYENLDTAQQRYTQGLIEYLPVLSALQAKQMAELQLLQSVRQRLSYRIQLCRALGGTWTGELTSPEKLSLKETAVETDAETKD